tara:strand:+ start:5411 stop:9328 length:3918 start_codon:yes stop_codon:yes gene_type:complete
MQNKYDTEYYNRDSESIKDNTFEDAAKNNDYILNDMITFLKSRRKGYKDEDFGGTNGLTKQDVIDEVNEHFRVGIGGVQNLVTMTRDFNFMNDDKNTKEEKDAYSRLMLAFTNQGETTDFNLKKGLDYVEGAVTDPANILSVLLGVGTGGVGTLAVQGAKKVGKKVAADEIKEKLIKKVRDQLLKNSLVVAGVEGTLGLGAGALSEATKVEIGKNVGKKYEFNKANVLARGGIQAVAGGTLNYATGAIPTLNLPFTNFNLTRSRKDQAVKIFDETVKGIENQKKIYEKATNLAEEAIKEIGSANISKKAREKKAKIFKDITNKLNFIDRSPPNLKKSRVEKGMELKLDKLLTEETRSYEEVIGGFNVDQLKRIAAAGMELVETIDVKFQTTGPVIRTSPSRRKSVDVISEPTLRITDKLADVFERGLKQGDGSTIEGQKLVENIKKKYKLSNNEFSSIFAAEFSEAGKKLNLAMQLSKEVRKDTLDNLLKLHGSLDKLVANDASGITLNREMTNREKQMYIDSFAQGITLKKAYNALRRFEDTRVGFMTTQIATTARNTFFGGIYVGLDAMEYTAANVYRLMTTGSAVQEIEKQVRGTPIARSAKDMSLIKRFNIFNGSFDIVKNLVFTRSEAEAIQALLQEPYAKELAGLFNKRAIIESELGNTTKGFGSGALNIATKLNFLNSFSDHQFKRAVLVGNLNRRLRTAPNADTVGYNIQDVINRGTVNQVDERIFLKAVDEAYNKSFQTQFGQTGEHVTSKYVNQTLDLFKKSVIGTMIIPFPRFVASQAKFINDYIPFAFLWKNKYLDFRPTSTDIPKYTLNIKDPFTNQLMFKAVSRNTDAENFGKGIAGVIALGGGYLLAASKAKDGYNFDEMPVGEGEKKSNILAMLGPLALHSYVGDVLYRYVHGMPLPEMKDASKQVSKLLVGTDLRVQTPVSKVAESIITGNTDKLISSLSDLTASITYPLAVFKDAYGQFDPRSAAIPDTSNATSNIFEIFGLGFDLALVQRATRFVPDVPFLRGSSDSIDITVDDTSMNPKYEKYDITKYSPFDPYYLYLEDPLYTKQLLGVEVQQPKSTLRKELSFLQLNEFNLHKSYLQDNKFIDLLLRRKLSNVMPILYERIINNEIPTNYNGVINNGEIPFYYRSEGSKQGYKNDKARRTWLEGSIKGFISVRKESLNKEFQEMEENYDPSQPQDLNLLYFLRAKAKKEFTKKNNDKIQNYLLRYNDEQKRIFQSNIDSKPIHPLTGQEMEFDEFDIGDILVEYRKINKDPENSNKIPDEIATIINYLDLLEITEAQERKDFK